VRIENALAPYASCDIDGFPLFDDLRLAFRWAGFPGLDRRDGGTCGRFGKTSRSKVEGPDFEGLVSLSLKLQTASRLERLARH
jgi:hypothetical protein